VIPIGRSGNVERRARRCGGHDALDDNDVLLAQSTPLRLYVCRSPAARTSRPGDMKSGIGATGELHLEQQGGRNMTDDCASGKSVAHLERPDSMSFLLQGAGPSFGIDILAGSNSRQNALASHGVDLPFGEITGQQCLAAGPFRDDCHAAMIGGGSAMHAESIKIVHRLVPCGQTPNPLPGSLVLPLRCCCMLPDSPGRSESSDLPLLGQRLV